MRNAPSAALAQVLSRPASREAWLEIVEWFFAHRSDPDFAAAVTNASAALESWPHRLRRIDIGTFLWELYRGDEPQPYWDLGRALAINLSLLADRRFAQRGLDIIRGLPVLIVERENRARVRHAAGVIERSLGRMPSIRELVLDDARMGELGVAVAVGAAPALRSLSIRLCGISATSLVPILGRSSAATLNELDVSDNKLDFSDFLGVAHLPVSGTIRRLSFSGNTMSLVGERIAVATFPALETLDLSRCHLSLAEALLCWRAPRLQELNLSHQLLRSDDILALAEWLPDSISKLSLSATGLQGSEMAALRALVETTRLGSLDLRDNAVVDEPLLQRLIDRHGFVAREPGVYECPTG